MQRGQGDMFWIIVTGIMALAVAGLFMYVLSQGFGGVNTAAKSSELQRAFEAAKSKGISPTQTDIDKDRFPDVVDFCVVKPQDIQKLMGKRISIPATDPVDLALLGNNNCDTDRDGVPDICDPEPLKPDVLCTKEGTPGFFNADAREEYIGKCPPLSKTQYEILQERGVEIRQLAKECRASVEKELAQLPGRRIT